MMTPEDRLLRALGSTRADDDGNRVLGGVTVASTQFPSCVCLGDDDGWFCSGVLVSPTIALTAAHCGADLTRALVGKDHIPTDAADCAGVHAVARVELHPPDPAGHLRHDLAIVFLSAPVAQTFARLASDAELAAAPAVHIAGYGHADPEGQTGFGHLRTVRVGLGPIATAAGQHADLGRTHGYDPLTEFLAGRRLLGRDSCKGDSGGPAYIMVGRDFRLAGLTSRQSLDAVRPCGDGGIYVRPLAYRTWLEGHGVALAGG